MGSLTGKIKLIITDLDNTALLPDKTLSKKTIEVFRKAREQGIHTGINTARPYKRNEDLFEELGVDCGIVDDGAVVIAENKIAYSSPINPEKANVFLSELALNKECSYISVFAERSFYNSHLNGNIRDNKYTVVYDDFTKPINETIYKIIAVIEREDLAEELADKFDFRLQKYRGESLYCFVNHDTGKMYSLRKLCEYLHISTDEVAAFGDDYGDIEMITECGVGVAVGNALEEAKMAADYVCKANYEDGVAAFIEECIL